MGLGASLFRACFVRREVSRSDYPDVNQAKLSDKEEYQKTDCAPAADVNAVRRMHLADKQSDEEVAEELRKDMGTRPLGTPNPGTEPDELIKGTEKYFQDHGKKTKSWWCGWGAGQTQRKGSNKAPSFNWIARSLMKDNQEVVLQIGMYKKDAKGNLKRVAGHYITCTGYTKEGLSLKVDDPAPRAERKEHTLKTKELKSGKLEAGSKSISAKAYLELEGLDLKEGSDIAVIDGAYAYRAK